MGEQKFAVLDKLQTCMLVCLRKRSCVRILSISFLPSNDGTFKRNRQAPLPATKHSADRQQLPRIHHRQTTKTATRLRKARSPENRHESPTSSIPRPPSLPTRPHEPRQRPNLRLPRSHRHRPKHSEPRQPDHVHRRDRLRNPVQYASSTCRSAEVDRCAGIDLRSDGDDAGFH